MRKTFTVIGTILCFVLLAVASASAQHFLAEGYEKELSVESFAPGHLTVSDEVHAAYDFDQDGHLEFFVLTDESVPNGPYAGQCDGAAVYLYENTGTDSYELIWTFRDTSLSTGCASFPACAVTDMDGDGWHELLIGMPYGAGYPSETGNPTRFYVFEGSATGLPAYDAPTATWNFTADPGSNTRPSGMAAADIDGDGVVEVATGFRAYSTASVNDCMMIFSLQGAFAGPFTQFKIEVYDTTSDIGSIYWTEVTDLDNDGHMEACFPSYSNDALYLFEGTGPDTYELYSYAAGVWDIQALDWADIDGDGMTEIVQGRADGYFYLHHSVTDLATIDSTNTTRIGLAWAGGIRGQAAGDYDGDGLADIFFGGNWDGAVVRVEYSGTGSILDSTSYSWQKIYQFPHDTSEARVYDVCFPGDTRNIRATGNTITDMDGDDIPELLIAHETGDSATQSWLFMIEGNGVTAVELNPGEQVLKSYTLHQNYPNPFNPTTSITFEMPKAERVTIEIYNSLGRKVRTLVNNKMTPAGVNDVVWNSRDDAGSIVPSGVYLCRVQMGSLVLTREMTLVK